MTRDTVRMGAMPNGPALVGGARAGLLVLLAVLAGLLCPTLAQAQVQRSFINLGFETPPLNSDNNPAGTGCYRQLYPQNYTGGDPRVATVPGWRTTHPVAAAEHSASNANCDLTPYNGFNYSGRLIEIWRNNAPYASANPRTLPRDGNQFAELNAQQASTIYQRVCLVPGETIGWRFSHKGRNSATVADVANFLIGTANDNNNTMTGTVIVQASDANDANPGAASNCIAGGTCSRTTFNGGTNQMWGDYSGQFTVPAASGGVRDIGFQAVSSSGGVTVGNFIDDIQITLKPFIEFEAATYTVNEAAGDATIRIRVAGVVPAAFTVPVTLSGTATSGSDYSTFAVTIPAGDYGDGTGAAGGFLGPVAVTVPITNDSIIENNEMLILTIAPGTAQSPYVLTSTSTCNSGAQGSTTLTIIDDDVDLQTTKSASTATPTAGVPFTYTVTYRNNTAATTVGPTTSHDVANAPISDAVPTGLTFTSWTCAASGGASCPSASGSGAISGNATLPAGNGAAGGMLTYTITAVANGAPNCSAIDNKSTITLPSAWQEGTSAQNGFTTPAPGGAANNTATVQVDPACAPTLTLNKVTQAVAGGPFTFALTNTTQTTGTVTTTSGGSPTQVDGAAAAGVQPFNVAAVGTAVTVNENSLPANWTLASATCQAGAAQVGSLSGTTYTIPAASVVEGTNLTCTFSNARQPSLTLVKTVTNDDGGTQPANAWTLSAAGPTAISGATGSAAVTNAAVNPGTYTLSESATPTGYAASAYSCVKNGGAAVSGNSIALVAGDVATCTINNNDQPATLTLVKTVTNDNGGTQAANAWTLTASGPTSISGATGSTPVTNATVQPGTYALSETGPANYVAGPWTCTAGTLAGSSLTLAAGQNATCTINNDDSNGADLSITKSNNTTSATVGTQTTYTITVTNAGPAAVVNSVVTDNPDPAHLTGCVVSTQCSVTSGIATCPAAGALTMANLSGAGVPIPSMSANSTIQFSVTCTVQ